MVLRVGETGQEGETSASPLTVSFGRPLKPSEGTFRRRDRRDSTPFGAWAMLAVDFAHFLQFLLLVFDLLGVVPARGDRIVVSL